ncbi:serine-rich adhesin for platelets-like isoform X3 [Dreissena polymorpha]|uniref:serine-rich adhesin for platelets-like isoform X3 n=1 Tax=Dreissena polymorpha TaxID=45954 RepID=UPI0022655B96|nr:serine-rich adhesin for platelets-like isoform X3 [Dreissena polymorpha]
MKLTTQLARVLLFYTVLCHRYHHIESSTTESSTETLTSVDLVPTSLTDTASDAAGTTGSSDTTSRDLSITGSSDTTTSDLSITGSSDTTTSDHSVDSSNSIAFSQQSIADETTIEPCVTCASQRLLPLTIVLSFLAGMLVVVVPAYMYIRRIWCFYNTSDRGSCASDKVTDKVIQKLTLERLNELEIKQRKKELEFSASNAYSPTDKGPDIVITEFNGRNSYEKFNSANSQSMSQKAGEHNYYECSVESKNVRGDKEEVEKNDTITYKNMPLDVNADSVNIEVTKNTADSPVVFKRGIKNSNNDQAKQAALLSHNPLIAHGQETSMPENQTYAHERSLSDKRLHESERGISSSEKELREHAPDSLLLSDKQLYEHARESVISAGDWNGLLALQNENFRDSNQLSQVF